MTLTSSTITLQLDKEAIHKLFEIFSLLNKNEIDWTPYLILLSGVFLAIGLKKFYTHQESKRLEKLFFLWNSELVNSLKKQSDSFKKKADSLKSIDFTPQEITLYGISTKSKTILSVGADKYFHLLISNRFKGENLMNLFHRTLSWYSLFIDDNELTKEANKDLFLLLEKAGEEWNVYYREFTLTINNSLQELHETIGGHPDLIEFGNIFQPLALKFNKLQNDAERENRQITKTEVIKQVKEIFNTLAPICRNRFAIKILDSCDNILASEIRFKAYVKSVRSYYLSKSNLYLKGHIYLKLYLKLWKKTKKKPVILTQLYKPSDY